MRFAIAAVMLAVVNGNLQASFIRFEGIAPTNGYTNHDNSSFSSDGFSFFQGHGHLIDSNYSAGYSSNNGTDWLMNDSSSPMTFSQIGGAAFSLNQLDLGNYYNPRSSFSATVMGTFAGGGTISQVVAYGGQFSTIGFSSSWSNLASVSIQSNDFFTVDNIEVNRATVTPEPTSLALASFAGLGMAVGAWRRRRQQAA